MLQPPLALLLDPGASDCPLRARVPLQWNVQDDAGRVIASMDPAPAEGEPDIAGAWPPPGLFCGLADGCILLASKSAAVL